jgi:hypothetical protein
MPTLMRLALLPMTCVVALAGCNRAAEKGQSPLGGTATEKAQMEAKMHLVVQEAMAQAKDPADKAAFEAGEIFTNIQGLEMSLVGISLRLDSGKRVRVSFANDHFKATPVTQLAQEALEDFRRAKVPEQPANNH